MRMTTDRTNAERESLRSASMPAFWAVVILACLMVIGGGMQPAAAADPQTREIERLLWVLDYYNGDLNGIADAKFQAAEAGFLADRNISGTLSSDEMLARLRKAFDERLKKARAEATKGQVVAARPIENPTTLLASKRSNLIVAGSCASMHLFRLDDLRPLSVVTQPACMDITGLTATNTAYVQQYSDGLMVRDLDFNLKLDLITQPAADQADISGGVTLPDADAALVHTLHRSVEYVDRVRSGAAVSLATFGGSRTWLRLVQGVREC